MAGVKVPTHIRKICELLQSERSEFRCAAAIVLGELGLKSPYIVKSLGELLNNGEDEILRGHILDAFEKIRSKESLRFLLPFLFHSNNSSFSKRAITIASSLGSESTKELKAMLKKAEPKERCIINSIFIKMRTMEGFKVIIESLKDENETVVGEVCRLVKEEAKDLSASEKKTFCSKVEQFLLEKKSTKSRQSLSAAIKILGYIGSPDSYYTLMSFTTLQNHPFLRSQALMALKNVPPPSNIKIEVIKKLVGYLDESDFTNIVSPTLDILIRMPFQTRLSDLVIRLLDNQHDAVRRFSIKKMRELNSPKVVKVLVGKLTDSDPALRDLAAESLCWLDSARTILLDKMLEEDELELCRLYAKILKPHATKFRTNQIAKLTLKLNEYIDENNPLQEPFLVLIRTVAPDYLHENLLSRGKSFKRRKNYEQAAKSLEILRKNGHFDADAEYELAVCLLKLSSKNPTRQNRDSDPCLSLFQHLIQDGSFPLYDTIKSDRILQREDLFYIAQHFMEKLQVERVFGGELLKLLVKKHPRSKVGLASKKLLGTAQM